MEDTQTMPSRPAMSAAASVAKQVAMELINHERVVEHNLPPIDWLEVSADEREKYVHRAIAALLAFQMATK